MNDQHLVGLSGYEPHSSLSGCRPCAAALGQSAPADRATGVWAVAIGLGLLAAGAVLTKSERPRGARRY